MLFHPRGSKYKRLKASHSVATCPQSLSSTDATITANNHKEPKCIDSGMSVCIGGPIHAPDSDDDVDSNWDERLAPFMLAVATPNFGKAHGTSPPPHYQRNSSPSHDHSLTTDESNYTDTDDGNTSEALRTVFAYPPLLKDRSFTPSDLQALRSRFRQIISAEDKVSSFRRRAKRTNSDGTRRLGRPDQDCGLPNGLHGLHRARRTSTRLYHGYVYPPN
jgi:hypothetical protein